MEGIAYFVDKYNQLDTFDAKSLQIWKLRFRIEKYSNTCWCVTQVVFCDIKSNHMCFVQLPGGWHLICQESGQTPSMFNIFENKVMEALFRNKQIQNKHMEAPF